MLEPIFSSCVSEVDQYLRRYVDELAKALPSRAKGISESVAYSLFSGGKRFRPTLSLLTAKALGISTDKVLPFAAAVEMVHTYSLIHDDLPCMDNDELRRGKPTNHVLYGEAMALLAGDALLTEAWRMMAKAYKQTPEIAVELIDQLTTAAGVSGMIAGQVMDLDVQGRLKKLSQAGKLTSSELETLHDLKTGALIKVSVTGVGAIAKVTTDKKQILNDFGHSLGLCFQLSDDVQDYRQEKPEPNSFPGLIGIEATQKLLLETTDQTLQLVQKLGPDTKDLHDLIMYNLKRLN